MVDFAKNTYNRKLYTKKYLQPKTLYQKIHTIGNFIQKNAYNRKLYTKKYLQPKTLYQKIHTIGNFIPKNTYNRKLYTKKYLQSETLYQKDIRQCRIHRSSNRRYSVKKGVLRNFKKFTGKQLYQRLFFNKVAGRSETLLRKRLWDKCFPVNFAKFLKAPFLTKHLWWLLLYTQPALAKIKL